MAQVVDRGGLYDTLRTGRAYVMSFGARTVLALLVVLKRARLRSCWQNVGLHSAHRKEMKN